MSDWDSNKFTLQRSIVHTEIAEVAQGLTTGGPVELEALKSAIESFPSGVDLYLGNV